MTCPLCRHPECRRSRRRTRKDYFLGLFGVLPWRCGHCEQRFYARVVPFSAYFYAHCTVCGNFVLERIPGEHVPGLFSWVGRLMHVRALRCEHCRHKFFTLRPRRSEALRAGSHSAD